MHSNISKSRWGITRDEDFPDPVIDVLEPAIDKNKTLIMPPILREVIKDHILNVLHSSSPLRSNETEGQIDMECEIVISKNNSYILMKNNSPNDLRPKDHLHTAIVESFQGKNVEYSSARAGSEYTYCVKIPLLTVSDLGDM